MSDEHLERVRALTHLRPMLRRLILEAHSIDEREPERAAHLHDAVSDLRIIIARLEALLRTAKMNWMMIVAGLSEAVAH